MKQLGETLRNLTLGLICLPNLLGATDLLPPPTLTPFTYACEIIIVAKDLTNGSAEFHYDAAGSGETHGGQAYPFAVQKHKVVANSTARWLSLEWSRNGELIAQSLTALGEDSHAAQALIVYNPRDMEEQASIDCLPKNKK